jgi:hypothetical protein
VDKDSIWRAMKNPVSRSKDWNKLIIKNATLELNK